MKKMYLAIFLIILVVFVFAGCLSFSDTLGSSLTTQETEDPYYDPETTDVYVPEVTQAEITSSSSSDTPEATTSSQSVTEPDSQNETTTKTPSDVVIPVSSEYDILKSGTFHMKGSMVDASGTAAPMEIAITPDSIYMLSDFSGTSMGMLIKGKSIYMIYPEKTAYLELSDSIMNMAGLDVDELVNSDSVNFSNYGNLSEASSITEEACNGHACTVYHFNVSTGETKVFMDGNKLIRLATYDKNGKFLSSTDIDTISSSVPADKSAPPSSYKAYKGMTGMFSFMTLLEDVM